MNKLILVLDIGLILLALFSVTYVLYSMLHALAAYELAPWLLAILAYVFITIMVLALVSAGEAYRHVLRTYHKKYAYNKGSMATRIRAKSLWW